MKEKLFFLFIYLIFSGISPSRTQSCAKGSRLCGSQCFDPLTSSCMSCGSGFGISSS